MFLQQVVRGRHGSVVRSRVRPVRVAAATGRARRSTSTSSRCGRSRSEEHTSELQSLMRNSYAVFCLKKKNKTDTTNNIYHTTHANTTILNLTHTNKTLQSTTNHTLPPLHTL